MDGRRGGNDGVGEADALVPLPPILSILCIHVNT